MATTDEQTTTDSQTGYADASIKRVTAENAIEYAYSDLGAGDVPLRRRRELLRRLPSDKPQ